MTAPTKSRWCRIGQRYLLQAIQLLLSICRESGRTAEGGRVQDSQRHHCREKQRCRRGQEDRRRCQKRLIYGKGSVNGLSPFSFFFVSFHRKSSKNLRSCKFVASFQRYCLDWHLIFSIFLRVRHQNSRQANKACRKATGRKRFIRNK